jgi:signal transduction histidine kinase
MRFAPSRRFQNSISIRIASLFCLTFVLGLALVFGFTYWELSYSLENSSKEVISSKLQEIAAIVSAENISGLNKYLSDDKNKILNAPFMIRVMDPEGKSLYMKPSIQEKNFDFDAAFREDLKPETMIGWHALSAINDEDMFDMLTQKIGTNLYLQVGESSEDRQEVLENIASVFGIAALVLIIISGGLGVWYARKSLLPIRNLLSTIDEIEKGDLGRRVPLPNSKGELRDLSETFNRMIARIEKLIQIMKDSLDNVAHDIRTPLTRIRAVAEDALLSNDTALQQSALEDCAESATDISGMVDQLMSISEADAGTLVIRYEDCNILTLIDDVVEIYEFVAQEKDISIEVNVIPPHLSWKLDRKRIKQVIGNLIDNAIKFSPAGSYIFINAAVESEQLKIYVKDQGLGIPFADLPKIWDRLFRGDKSRTTHGAGLGLSIVRSIVMAHGGHAEAIPSSPSGMIFKVSIPLTQS